MQTSIQKRTNGGAPIVFGLKIALPYSLVATDVDAIFVVIHVVTTVVECETIKL